MEVVEYANHTVVMDGAHNPQKMTALVGSLQAKFPDQKFNVLIGMLSGKDLEETLKVVAPIVASVTATSFKAEQDMPRGSIALSEVTTAAHELGLPNVAGIEGPAEAFEKILQQSDNPVLVTGSFFLLNYIRPLIFIV
jgi:dihydrofolate synthase/folylpolyglutamate synthase